MTNDNDKHVSSNRWWLLLEAIIIVAFFIVMLTSPQCSCHEHAEFHVR